MYVKEKLNKSKSERGSQVVDWTWLICVVTHKNKYLGKEEENINIMFKLNGGHRHHIKTGQQFWQLATSLATSQEKYIFF